MASELPDAAYKFGDGKNAVNVLLVDIRAWDTLGEISVLLVAATGVASMVFRHRRFGAAPRVADATRAAPAGPNPTAENVRRRTTWLRGSDFRDPRHRSLVLEVTTRLVFPTMMVLSMYFFFAGHNAPGGGFAGGLTMGLALVLRYLAGGRYELGEALPIDAGRILGVGPGLLGGTAVASVLLGAPGTVVGHLRVHPADLRRRQAGHALFFDLGVYLIVVGLVLDVLRSLGARLDEDPPRRRREPQEARVSVNLGLLIVVGLMAACGVYLLLERSLIRMLLGLLLVGNAINLLIVTVSGAMGNPPIIGRTADERSADADPLAQGMVLTAIVITMGMAAFVLGTGLPQLHDQHRRRGGRRPRGPEGQAAAQFRRPRPGPQPTIRSPGRTPSAAICSMTTETP